MGLGVAVETKMNVLTGCFPSDSPSDSRITPVGKSLQAKQDPERVRLSQYLPAQAFTPLYALCAHYSHKTIILTCWFPKAKPSLDINPFVSPSCVALFLHPCEC